MLTFFERELVEKRKWITHEEFIESVALGQMTPGPPIVNTGICIGYKLKKIKGALITTAGQAFTGTVLAILLAIFYRRAARRARTIRRRSCSPAAPPALPKGILLSNRNFIAEGMQAAAWGGMAQGHSILAILPIFHGFGLGVCVNAAFMAGGKSILVPMFSAEVVAKLLRTQAAQPAGGRAHAVRRPHARPVAGASRSVLPARHLLRRRHAAAAGEGALREARGRARRPGETARGLRPHRGGHRDHGDAAGRVSRRLDRHSFPGHAGQDLPRRHRGGTPAGRRRRDLRRRAGGDARLSRRPRSDARNAAAACRRPHLAAYRRPRQDGCGRLLLFHRALEAHDQVLGLQRLPGAGRSRAVPASAGGRGLRRRRARSGAGGAGAGLRRAQGPGAGERRHRARLDRALPRAADQMVLPARDRVLRRAAEDARGQDRLQGAGAGTRRQAECAGRQIR